MGKWIESVERKASIIHTQLAAARSLAVAHGASADSIAAPYLNLLRNLYAEEFPFAQLSDASDLVARFKGPSVDIHDPTVSIVSSLLSELREQIRGIAKSVVGLATDTRVLWPAQLDPHLSGIAHGSLLVGVSVSAPEALGAKGQLEIEGASTQVFESVRSAIRSLSLVARYVNDSGIDDSIRDAFPDPAIRDTVLVAARRLAPTGRRGIDSISFFTPEIEEQEVQLLTPKSRQTLSSALITPVKTRGDGTFEGLLREVDLDARRFEIRGVSGIGAIRCVYGPQHDALVRAALDAKVRITGQYEVFEGSRPRFVAVNIMERLTQPLQQLPIPE